MMRAYTFVRRWEMVDSLAASFELGVSWIQRLSWVHYYSFCFRSFHLEQDLREEMPEQIEEERVRWRPSEDQVIETG